MVDCKRPLGRTIIAGSDDAIYRWLECPDCGGRGYFVVNPFAPTLERRQCLTCEAGFKAHASAPSSSRGGEA